MIQFSSFRLSLVLVSILLFPGTSLPEEKYPVYLDAGRGQKPFDISVRSIPQEAIRHAGPPRDGIPALDYPSFSKADAASSFLKKRDRVIGVIQNGVAKAYPVKVLNWHEVVNDEIGGRPITVTY